MITRQTHIVLCRIYFRHLASS